MLLLLFLLSSFQTLASALFQEEFVAFNPGNGSLAISGATIIYAADDPVGVSIAAKDLASDFQQITGKEHHIVTVQGTNSSNSSTLFANVNSRTAIIVGSVNSELIRRVERSSGFNVSDIRGKWETFRTAVVKRPLPGIENALVIAGSDKRGTMFGVYTLSEQAGQSP